MEENEGTNVKSASVYQMKNGKLSKVTTPKGYLYGTARLLYTKRPQLISKNVIQIARYDNAIGKYIVETLKFDPVKSKFTLAKIGKYSVNSSIIKHWKKIWR